MKEYKDGGVRGWTTGVGRRQMVSLKYLRNFKLAESVFECLEKNSLRYIQGRRSQGGHGGTGPPLCEKYKQLSLFEKFIACIFSLPDILPLET